MLLLSLPATAADWIGGTDADWATAANWSVAPVEGSALVFQAAGTSGAILGNTLAAGFDIGGVTFSAGAAAFTMGGNAFDLAGNITQSSATTQTLDHDITIIGAARTLQVDAGCTLALGGTIGGGGFRLDKTGGGTLAIAGGASAVGAIVTPWTADSTIDIPAGGSLAAASLNNISGIASTTGKVNIACAGDLAVSGNFALNNNVAGAVALTQTGGTVSLTSTAGDDFNNVVTLAARVAATTRNDYHLQGGTLNVPNTNFYCAVGGSANGRLNITGGTANLKGVKLSGTSASAVGALALDGGRLNLGVNGLINGATNMAGSTVTLGAGTLGALADWSSAKDMILSDPGTGVTLNTLDAADGITPRTITLNGVLSGTGSLVKNGEGVLNLEAANTYSGNTVVNAGSLQLGTNGRLRFAPGANGVSNTLSGSGTVTLNGGFFLDLANAALAQNNQWPLVTATGETYDPLFVIDSSMGGFARSGTFHTLEAAGNTWTFNESTGLLTFEVPPPPPPQDPAHRVVFYVNGQDNWITWWSPLNLRLHEMTHLIYFYPEFDPATGSIGALPPAHEAMMVEVLRRCREQRVVCQYGFAAGFSAIKPFLENATQRQAIADALVERVTKYDFDGLDIDVEYAPTNADANLLGTFIAELRERLGRRRLLTAAVADRSWGGGSNTIGTVPWTTIRDHLDWANVMAYGAGSANSESFAVSVLNQYANLGVTRGKLVLGVPFFGRVQVAAGEPSLGSAEARAWKELATFIQPYDETTDSVVLTVNGHTYQNPVIVNNRETQRSKARLAADSANGSMVWVAHCDSTDSQTNLGIPLWETSQAYSAMVDGFEMPTLISATGAYLSGGTNTSPAPVQLTGSYERIGGNTSLQVAMNFAGQTNNNAWFRQRALASGWNFTTGSTLRFEINPLTPLPRGSFYLRLYDGSARRTQSSADNTLVRSSGWKRKAYTRSGFTTVDSGFNWADIRQAEFFVQLASGASPASENLLLNLRVDHLVLVDPGTPRPVRHDLDSDGDLLPDVLELALGSNPQQPDSNGDGADDGDTAMFSGNPLGAPPRIGLQSDGSSGLLEIPVLPGRTVRVESSTDLNLWTHEAELSAAADGTPLTLDVNLTGARRFYRVGPAR